MKITSIIMAGGKGERFWPKSRQSFPKQFLSLTADGKTMLQHTVERIMPISKLDDIFVVTNKNYADIVSNQISGLNISNIINEPLGRNTAPCVAVAAAIIQKVYSDAVMVVLPADHLIKDNSEFCNTINLAVSYAQTTSSLITIGIRPNYPETGYGYIHHDSNTDNGIYNVINFVEKPDIEKAKEYLSSGRYLWNSGIFIWRSSVILEKFQELMPELYSGALKIAGFYGTEKFNSVLEEEFSKFKSISIDYGILEKTSDIKTIPADFGWNDVGSWLALDSINDKEDNCNILIGDTVTFNTKNSILVSDKRLIATVGVDDIIVVDTDDVVLVLKKSEAQNVKSIISILNESSRNKYL